MTNTRKNEIRTIRSYINLIEKNNTDIFNKTSKAKIYKKNLQDIISDIEADENGLISKNLNDLKAQKIKNSLRKIIKKTN